MVPTLIARLRSFRASRGGNVAITAAIVAIPLFGLLGFAIDYGVSLSNKAKLDIAADDAAMVAITTAKNIVNAQSGSLTTPTDALAKGIDQGKLAFKANAGRTVFGPVPTPVVSLPAPVAMTFTSTVTYATTVANNFSGIIGIPSTNISGKSVATLTLPKYQDFYLLLDVSGSMGLPSTDDGQTQLRAINHDNDNTDSYSGCQFACHFPGNVCSTSKGSVPCTGFSLAQANNIQLRAGAVGSAVCSLLQQALSIEQKQVTSLQQQYRVGIYPFIVNIGGFFPLSKDLASAMNAVNGNSAGCSQSNPGSAITALLDTGTPAVTGYYDPNTTTWAAAERTSTSSCRK